MLCLFNPAILPQAAAVPCASAGPHAKMVKGVSSNAARLGRDRSRIRLHRVPVSGCKLWRPPVADAARPRQRADLSTIAGNLLHLLDVLRLGWIRHTQQLRFPRHLYRSDPDDRAVHATVAPRDPARQIAE